MPNTKYDFEGKIINKLRVEKYVGRSKWECTCLECGKKTIKTSWDLDTKRAYSCGCCNRYTDEDLTGQHFGRLTAQYKVKGKDGRTLWHCICDCGSGKDIDVRASDLLKGKIKSCGCMRHSNKANDLIGQTFNYLKVIGREPNNKEGRSMWRCKCLYNNCGNEVIVKGKNLLNGNTKSCGCLKHKDKAEDLSGQRFGRLVVKNRVKGDKAVRWHCECDCGNEIDVLADSLVHGLTKSCGCYRSELVANKNKKDAYDIRPYYPQWFIDELANEEDKERARNRMITTCENLDFYCPIHGVYNQAVSNHIRLGDFSKVYGCPRCFNNIAHAGSKEENIIRDFIENMGYKTEKTKKVLSGREIDIYIDLKNIGVEYNGSVYHASLNGVYKDLDKYYYRDKFLEASNNGVHLINIFDVDWQNNKDKIKMYLKSLFVLQESIMARKCEVKKVSNDIACEFVEKYHLQGANKAMMKINYGLYYEGELYAIMSFGKLRLNKTEEGQYELHRYCVKDGYTIIGGAQKLMKAFEKEYTPKYVLSYSDNDYFLGGIYLRLGFEYKGQSVPRYYWYLNGQEIKREACQLKRLKVQYPKLLEEAYNVNAPNKEDYVMLNLGACKVYRSGNTKWEKYY